MWQQDTNHTRTHTRKHTSKTRPVKSNSRARGNHSRRQPTRRSGGQPHFSGCWDRDAEGRRWWGEIWAGVSPHHHLTKGSGRASWAPPAGQVRILCIFEVRKKPSLNLFNYFWEMAGPLKRHGDRGNSPSRRARGNSPSRRARAKLATTHGI